MTRPAASIVAPPRGPDRSTRDTLLGVGTALAALFALIAVAGTVPWYRFGVDAIIDVIRDVAVVVGLVTAAAALLGPRARRDRRLRPAGWSLALGFVLTTVQGLRLMPLILRSGSSIAAPSLDLTPARCCYVLMVLSWLGLAAAAALFALGFTRTDRSRHRLLRWAGLSVMWVALLDLPDLISGMTGAFGIYLGGTGPDGLPLVEALLILVAGALIWLAFARYSKPVDSPGRIDFAGREALLFVALLALLVPRLIRCGFEHWDFVDPPPLAGWPPATALALVQISSTLLQPTLFLFVALGFFVSFMKARRRPDATGSPPHSPSTRLDRVLTTWRLPLIVGWLVVIVTVSTIFAYPGLTATLAGIVHYALMVDRERRRRARRDVTPCHPADRDAPPRDPQ